MSSNYQRTETVPAGETRDIVLPDPFPDSLPLSIAIHPASGGSVSVSVSCDSRHTVENSPSITKWVPVETSLTTDKLVSIETPVRAIRVTATTQPATVSVTSFRLMR